PRQVPHAGEPIGDEPGQVGPCVGRAYRIVRPWGTRTVAPSPRARGLLGGVTAAPSSARSIPACAGITDPHCTEASRTPVHPRVRGAYGGVFSKGAGSPVHPRVRGAYHKVDSSLARRNGPSPRARGLLIGVAIATRRPRSIPACAGLTPTPIKKKRILQVHPRVRGAYSTLPAMIQGVTFSRHAWRAGSLQGAPGAELTHIMKQVVPKHQGFSSPTPPSTPGPVGARPHSTTRTGKLCHPG